MKEYYSCFICDLVMMDKETFKVTKDDTFGHRYFCNQCLEQMKLSQEVICGLVTSDPKKQGAPQIGRCFVELPTQTHSAGDIHILSFISKFCLRYHDWNSRCQHNG